MASRLTNELDCIKHCWINVFAADWLAEKAIIASKKKTKAPHILIFENPGIETHTLLIAVFTSMEMFAPVTIILSRRGYKNQSKDQLAFIID